MKVSEKRRNIDQTTRRMELYKNDKACKLTPNGVERIVLDIKNNDAKSELILVQSNNPNEQYSLHRIGKDIVVSSPEQIYVVNEDGMLIESDSYLSLLGGAHRFANIQMDLDSNLWFFVDDALKIHKYDKSSGKYKERIERLLSLAN